MMSNDRRPCTVVGAIAIVAVACARPAAGFCLLSAYWFGGEAVIRYNFPPAGIRTNGTESWDANAVWALERWTAVTGRFQFTDGGPSRVGQDNRDGVNNMVFDVVIGGDAFGPETLAVTVTRSTADGDALESDIVFNAAVVWDAYAGPLHADRDGRTVFDFRRVALHELGHVLGLGHPDDSCQQTVPAIMNARTTDTEALTDDDRNGVSFIYADENEPPVAVAGGNQAGNGVRPFRLNGTASGDEDGFIALYQWRVNGELHATGPETEVALNFGTHIVALTVVDDDGGSDTDTIIIDVGPYPFAPKSGNRPPVADASDDMTMLLGESATLDASGSFDTDGEIVQHIWTEGESIIARSPLVPVVPSTGTHVYRITVFDDQGSAAADEVAVTVQSDLLSDPGPVINGRPPTVMRPSVAMCGPMAMAPMWVGLGVVLLRRSSRFR
ncbi:MAG: matrixin family metalloprotease [Phycisphaerales bacterium]|nr:matrixin family metalloprotease [Phycisphaerales bacterium]